MAASHRLLDHVFNLADAVSDRYRALVLLAAFGGLRPGELVGLRRRAIDIDSSTVLVEVQRQQLFTGEHLIGSQSPRPGAAPSPCPARCSRRWSLTSTGSPPRSPTPGASPDPSRPPSPGSWQDAWTRGRKEVDLPDLLVHDLLVHDLHVHDLHFHDLRHVAATLAAATGAGVKDIMHRIGHSSPQAALRDQHASARRDQAIADGISDLTQRERGGPGRTRQVTIR